LIVADSGPLPRDVGCSRNDNGIPLYHSTDDTHGRLFSLNSICLCSTVVTEWPCRAVMSKRVVYCCGEDMDRLIPIGFRKVGFWTQSKKGIEYTLFDCAGARNVLYGFISGYNTPALLDQWIR
jgi:hypothetical protein